MDSGNANGIYWNVRHEAGIYSSHADATMTDDIPALGEPKQLRLSLSPSIHSTTSFLAIIKATPPEPGSSSFTFLGYSTAFFFFSVYALYPLLDLGLCCYNDPRFIFFEVVAWILGKAWTHSSIVLMNVF